MGTRAKLSRRSLLCAGVALGGSAVLTACAGAATPQVVEKVVEKLVTAAPSELEGQVRVWTFPITDSDEDLIWKPLNQRLAEVYPKMQVNIEILPWSGRREKMLTAYAAGEQPDLAYVNTDTLSLFGTNDVLEPLDDIVAQEAWDDLPGSLDAGLSWEGKRLMFPNGLSGSGYLCNKAIMAEIGYDPENPPYTWDEIRELGAASVAKDYFMTSINTTQWGAWVEMVWQAGGNVYSADLTKVQMTSDAAHDTLQFLVDWFQGGWCPKEGAVGTEEAADAAAATDYWITGKQTYTGLAEVTITTNTRNQAPDLDFGYVPTWKYKRQVQMAAVACWGMFKKSKVPEVAAAWLNWIIEPEQQGFYSSVSKESPPRASAWQYWVAEAEPKKFTELHFPFMEMNQDSSYFWQEGKVTCAPQFQAAVLGQKSVDQALADAQTELQKIVDDWNAKRTGA